MLPDLSQQKNTFFYEPSVLVSEEIPMRISSEIFDLRVPPKSSTSINSRMLLALPESLFCRFNFSVEQLYCIFNISRELQMPESALRKFYTNSLTRRHRSPGFNCNRVLQAPTGMHIMNQFRYTPPLRHEKNCNWPPNQQIILRQFLSINKNLRALHPVP